MIEDARGRGNLSAHQGSGSGPVEDAGFPDGFGAGWAGPDVFGAGGERVLRIEPVRGWFRRVPGRQRLRDVTGAAVAEVELDRDGPRARFGVYSVDGRKVGSIDRLPEGALGVRAGFDHERFRQDHDKYLRTAGTAMVRRIGDDDVVVARSGPGVITFTPGTPEVFRFLVTVAVLVTTRPERSGSRARPR